jgi:hypothetical protein
MSQRLPALEVEPPFREAIEAGAAQNFTSLSGYMRIALVEQLKKDGLHPARCLVDRRSIQELRP